jgi:aryl-alcohol dehydrogenase-like predicted oxidoreductase
MSFLAPREGETATTATQLTLMVLQNALHQLVADGKVLYLGISDTPAWVVVKCNECKSATKKELAIKPAILADTSQMPATMA